MAEKTDGNSYCAAQQLLAVRELLAEPAANGAWFAGTTKLLYNVTGELKQSGQ